MAYSNERHEFHFMFALWKHRNNSLTEVFNHHQSTEQSSTTWKIPTNVDGMNNSSSDYRPNMINAGGRQPSFTTLTATHIAIAVLLSCILLIGVLGNALVIYIFGVKRSSTSHQQGGAKRFEKLLTLLAVVDLISSSIVPSTFLYLTLTNYQEWDFGYIGCKVIPPLLQVSITISHGVLIFIMYERYNAIYRPFDQRSKAPGKAVYTWLFATCVVSVVMAIPYAQTLDLVDAPDFHVRTCLPRAESQSLQLISACIYLTRDIFTITVMVFFYCRMDNVLTKQFTIVNWDRSTLSVKGRRVLRTVVIVFLLLTLPVDIFQVSVLSIFVTGQQVTVGVYENLVIVNTLLQILQISNSVSNIFIYSKLQTNFKRFFGLLKTAEDEDELAGDGGGKELVVCTDKIVVRVIQFDAMFDDTDISSCASL